MDGIYQFGIALIQGLQTMSPGLDGFMGAVTFLGTIEFYILFIPVLYWCVDQKLGLRVLFILILTDVPASSFKQLLHEPRPYWLGGVKALADETTYGIPSSHASNTLAVWGLIAATVKKSWLWTLSIVLILLIGLSRLYLGVHFPQDVLGGWLLGLLMLFVFIKYESRFLAWWKQKTIRYQILLGFLSLSSCDPARAAGSCVDLQLPRSARMGGLLHRSARNRPLHYACRFSLRGCTGRCLDG